MKYLRVDINKNYTILEISGSEYIDLSANEMQFSTNYDFPTSQPPYFYRVDPNTYEVLVNDEQTVKLINPQALTGLDMTPFIETVLNGDFTPLGNKIVTIEGLNFTPFSTVEISGEGNFVNTVYFDTPKKLRADITVGTTEDKFNLIVYNNDLQSDDSGFNSIQVKSKTVVDLRTIDPTLLGLEMTNGINYQQNSTYGMRFFSTTNSWNRGVKFGAYTWNRSDNVTFEIIFNRVSDVLFMLGIGSSSLNVNSISTAYYQQEIGMYHNNNSTTTFYGGGDVTNWSQNIGERVGFDSNKFYKLKFENSGGENALCLFSEVDPDDWDDETILHSWISTCPADDEILTPFLLPQASSGAYYITGFRF